MMTNRNHPLPAGIYIFTAAGIGQPLNVPFWTGLRAYANKLKGRIVVAPIATVGADKDALLAPELHKDPSVMIVGDSFVISRKLSFLNFHVRAEQMNPLTGIDRIVRNSRGPTSGVIPAAKQFFKSVADLTNPARGLWTTGTCTKPRYRTNRVGGLATIDHTTGALIVECGEDGYFHARHIRWKHSANCFTDLGTQVSVKGDKTTFKQVRASALVLGDWHSGDTCPKAVASCHKLIKLYRPKFLMIHDLFNGHSINHHERQQSITRARAFDAGRLTLEAEVDACANDLIALEASAPADGKVCVVASNHCDWATRYVQQGYYVDEPQNFALASAAAAEFANTGTNPLEYLIRNKRVQVAPGKYVFRKRAPFKKVKFLERSPVGGFRVNGWEVGEHGDAGINGSKGYTGASLDAAGRAIIGHKHSPEIFRSGIVVGTNTKLRLDYNAAGTSTWMHADAVVWPDGSVQLLVKLSQRDCAWSYLQ